VGKIGFLLSLAQTGAACCLVLALGFIAALLAEALLSEFLYPLGFGLLVGGGGGLGLGLGFGGLLGLLALYFGVFGGIP
jgi:hypothetical protein